MSARSGYLLIVEDDPDILKLLSTTLTFRGYRAVTARNGKEGLESARQERPGLVIADIMMPKLDGFGLVHRLRLDPETRDIPVIFITATYVAPEDQEFALSIGVTRFIQKPVDLESLLAIIADILQQGRGSTIEPLKESSFYEGYRTRLEVKLAEKSKQIARDERLLGSHSDREDEDLRASLRHAVLERDELILLLEQVNGYLEKLTKTE